MAKEEARAGMARLINEVVYKQELREVDAVEVVDALLAYPAMVLHALGGVFQEVDDAGLGLEFWSFPRMVTR